MKTVFNTHTHSLCMLGQRRGLLQHGRLCLRHSGRGFTKRLDPTEPEDVHQQKSGSGDQQLARGGGGEDFTPQLVLTDVAFTKSCSEIYIKKGLKTLVK